MKPQRLYLALTIANFALLVVLISPLHTLIERLEPERIPALVRAQSIEIVDTSGAVRIRLGVDPPSTLGGKSYPERIAVSLIDQSGRPLVAIEANQEGGNLVLSGGGESMHWYGAKLTSDTKGGGLILVDLDGKADRFPPR